MPENWDEDDWEKDDFQPVLPAKPASSLAADVDQAKFADEERMLAEAQREREHARVESQVSAKFASVQGSATPLPKPLYACQLTPPSSQPKKKEEKKYLKEAGPVDKPLDDPVEEKLRRQR
jgi:hypothetical protein